MDPGLSQTDVDRLTKSADLIRQDIARLEAENRGERDAGAPCKINFWNPA